MKGGGGGSGRAAAKGNRRRRLDEEDEQAEEQRVNRKRKRGESCCSGCCVEHLAIIWYMSGKLVDGQLYIACMQIFGMMQCPGHMTHVTVLLSIEASLDCSLSVMFVPSCTCSCQANLCRPCTHCSKHPAACVYTVFLHGGPRRGIWSQTAIVMAQVDCDTHAGTINLLSGKLV